MRIVAVSDTHNKISFMAMKMDWPDGDVLIHAGDATMRGDIDEIGRFGKELNAIVKHKGYKHVIFVPGNHDRLFEREFNIAADCLRQYGFTVLLDNMKIIDGIKFYGSPWTPNYFNWAFMPPRDEIWKKWERLPEEIDVLITHGPPYGILDVTYYKDEHGRKAKLRVGDKALLKKVQEIRPKVHIFGHIHPSYGQLTRNGVKFVNAAIVGDNFKIKNPPQIIDL